MRTAIVKSVPINSGLQHFVGQEVKVKSTRNFSFGKLCQVENNDGQSCEILESRLESNTPKG